MNEVRIQTMDQVFTGNILQRLRANNWDIGKALRTNATLPHDAWTAIDKTVLEVSERRLNGMADLRSEGLIRPLGGLGVMYDYWNTMSGVNEAVQDMGGTTKGENTTLDFGENSIPIPITHVDFTIPIRKLMASERAGVPLDTTQVAQATRMVIEKLEEVLFAGSPVVFGGYSLPGYINYTDSTSVSCTGSWATTPANIVPDVILLINALEQDRHYGPFMLYVHADEWAALRQINEDAGRTYYDIVKSMKGVKDIKPSDALSDGEIVLVEMSREVVDLAIGEDIQVVEWPGNMETSFKVFAAIAARIKSDYDGRCGIAFDSSIP